MLRRLRRPQWILAAIALGAALAGCKSGSGGVGY